MNSDKRIAPSEIMWLTLALSFIAESIYVTSQTGFTYLLILTLFCTVMSITMAMITGYYTMQYKLASQAHIQDIQEKR